MLSGVALLAILSPINYKLAQTQRNYQIQQMKKKDERVKSMNEILNGIKVKISTVTNGD